MKLITEWISPVLNFIGSTEPRHWVTSTGLLPRKTVPVRTHNMSDMIPTVHGLPNVHA